MENAGNDLLLAAGNLVEIASGVLIE